jgi:hypothetical protein
MHKGFAIKNRPADVGDNPNIGGKTAAFSQTFHCERYRANLIGQADMLRLLRRYASRNAIQVNLKFSLTHNIRLRIKTLHPLIAIKVYYKW